MALFVLSKNECNLKGIQRTAISASDRIQAIQLLDEGIIECDYNRVVLEKLAKA